jgi:hypothetical protein
VSCFGAEWMRCRRIHLSRPRAPRSFSVQRNDDPAEAGGISRTDQNAGTGDTSGRIHISRFQSLLFRDLRELRRDRSTHAICDLLILVY